MHGTAQPRFPGDEGHTQILFLFPRMAKGLDTQGTGILRAFRDSSQGHESDVQREVLNIQWIRNTGTARGNSLAQGQCCVRGEFTSFAIGLILKALPTWVPCGGDETTLTKHSRSLGAQQLDLNMHPKYCKCMKITLKPSPAEKNSS